MACYRYIEANPVRARIVTDVEAYPWSSYGVNALGQANRLISERDVYRRLGSMVEARQTEFRSLFAEVLGDDMVAIIRDATQRGWIAGSDKFRRQIEDALGPRVDLPARGGARNNDKDVLSSNVQSLLIER